MIKIKLMLNNKHIYKSKKYRKVFKLPKIKSIEETIEKILKDKCSMSRFGDGEIFIMLGYGGVKFQSYNKELSKRLRKIINSNDKNILICLHDAYRKIEENRTEEEKEYWKYHLRKYRLPLYKILDKEKVYYNSACTRFYSISENKDDANKYFELFKKIWEDKDVVIIEGKYTRVGVGNDLIKKCKSVSRIIIPAENAFDEYKKIYNEAIKIEKDKLILIAAGPTATVLAYDLNKLGYQAIDIGHIDIEYEWYLKGAKTREVIDGKYVNEVNYRRPKDICDNLYYDQIIKEI